jgi:hypothetical protein
MTTDTPAEDTTGIADEVPEVLTIELSMTLEEPLSYSERLDIASQGGIEKMQGQDLISTRSGKYIKEMVLSEQGTLKNMEVTVNEDSA